MFLWLVFHTSLSPLLILIIGETNARETSEFIKTFFITPGAVITYLSILLLILIFILAEYRYKEKIVKWLHNRYTYYTVCIVSVLLIALGGIQSKIIINLFNCKTIAELEKWGHENPTFQLDSFTTLLYSFQAPRISSHEVEKGIMKCKEVHQNQHEVANDSLTFVYILGESFIKHHSNLYGYSLTTTPCMSEEARSGRLFALQNIISPYNSTTLAEKNSFCCNRLADGEQWYDSYYFPTIFKATGYNVYIWDNQRDFDNNALFTFSVNAYIFNPTIQKYSYTAACNKTFTYDGELVEDFFQNVELQPKNNLIIFHLLGQHIGAADRFPHQSKFTRYTSKDIKRNEPYLTENKKQDIADYDNATYYNDLLIGKIIDKFKESNAVIVYFSDHGEEMYDYRDSKGRVSTDDTKNMLKYQYEIPFFIWCSKKYIQKHPNTITNIKKALQKPGTTDIVCQIAFHLAHLSTPFYNVEHDLLSDKYLEKKRMIGIIDYDSLMYSVKKSFP